jgi:hypothetical protein
MLVVRLMIFSLFCLAFEYFKYMLIVGIGEDRLMAVIFRQTLDPAEKISQRYDLSVEDGYHKATCP